MLSLFLAGQPVMRVDQRVLLALGFSVNAIALTLMSNVTLAADFWTLALPRLLQGFGMGFVFVPLQTLALARVDPAGCRTRRRRSASSATSAGASGSLPRRRCSPGAEPVPPDDARRPRQRLGCGDRGAAAPVDDAFLGARRGRLHGDRQALGMLHRSTLEQAQTLAYVEEFHLLALVFVASLGLLPFMRRVRGERRQRGVAVRDEGLPAPVE